MPTRPPKIELADQVAKRIHRKAKRAKTAARGYGSKWQYAARAYLKRHPLCAYHYARGEIVAAQVVDHIVPHKGDKARFWDSRNWQPLCVACHNVKSAKE